MAKRFTDTEMWDKEWFMNLSPRLKCLVKMVRDKCDLSGVWSPNWIIAKTYVGEKVTEKELLEIDGGKQFVKISGGKIYCIGFIEFQYGSLGEKSPVHRKILNLLDTHKIDYKHPIDRVKEEEEEKEVDKEEVKEEKKKGFIPPSCIEVENFFSENGYLPDAGKKAWHYYQDAQWKDSTGKPVLNWKQKMRGVWFKPENKNTETTVAPDPNEDF